MRFKNCPTIASLILVLLIVSISSLAAVRAESMAFNVAFSDDFQDDQLDDSKWIWQDNQNSSSYPAYGGSITVANSTVNLASNGSSYPCMYTRTNPFPETGDFVLEFDITFPQITSNGGGVWVSTGDVRAVTGMPYGDIFQVWPEPGRPGTSVCILLLGLLVNKTDALWNEHSSFPYSNPLAVKLSYSKGYYTVFLNGTEIAKKPSNLRPGFIALGHPPCGWVPFTEDGHRAYDWSSMRVDAVMVKTLPPAKLSISANAEPTQAVYRIHVNGQLTTPNSQPLDGEIVVLSYNIPGTADWNTLSAAETDTEGRYSAGWTPSVTGLFTIKAEWAGNEQYSGVYDVKNVSVLEGESEQIILAESNSTLSAIAFNSTSREIAFSVAGESGTTGYVKFLISKALMGNLSDFKVYLDGNETNFTITSSSDMFVLYFEYHHSQHDVLIKLPNSLGQVPEFQVWVLVPLFLTLALTVCFQRKWRKRHLP